MTSVFIETNNSQVAKLVTLVIQQMELSAQPVKMGILLKQILPPAARFVEIIQVLEELPVEHL